MPSNADSSLMTPMNRRPRAMAASWLALLVASATPVALNADAYQEAPCVLSDEAPGDFHTQATYPSYAQPWPGGRVVYRFVTGVPADMPAPVMQAMRELQQAADLLFVRMGKDIEPFVSIYPSKDSNSSMLGYRKTLSGQSLSLRNYQTNRVVLHELGHTLGLAHEMNRPDRDQFIQVLFENIVGYADQFRIDPSALAPTPYDFLSIMHYTASAFAKPGTLSIQCQPGYEQYQGLLGKGSHLSQGDIEGLRFRYGPPKLRREDAVVPSGLTNERPQAAALPWNSPELALRAQTTGPVYAALEPGEALGVPYTLPRVPGDFGLVYRVITGVRVDARCAASALGFVPEPHAIRVDVSGAVNARITSEPWVPQALNEFDWRLGSRGLLPVPEGGWTPEKIGSLTVTLRHVQGSVPLALDALNIIMITASDWDGDGLPDDLDPESSTGDLDRDLVPDEQDCAPLDPRVGRNAADLSDASGQGDPDGRLTASDVVVFFNGYFNGCAPTTSVCGPSDITDAPGTGGPDGRMTTSDILAFFAGFMSPCK